MFPWTHRLLGEKTGQLGPSLRLIPQLETYPRFVTFAESRLGKIILYLVFALLLASMQVAWPAFGSAAKLSFVFSVLLTDVALALPMVLAVTVCAAICAAAGKHRYFVMPFLTLCIFIVDPFWLGAGLPQLVATQEGVQNQIDFLWLQNATIAAFLLFTVVLLYCTHRFQTLLPFRRPVLSLIVFYFILVCIAKQAGIHGTALVALWSFISILGGYFWFLGYALLNQKTARPSPLGLQLATLHPFWGSSNVPTGKGAAHLQKVEAHTLHELTISQIKGLKLIVWCFILRIFYESSEYLIHSLLKIPDFKDALERQFSGNPYPIFECWMSLFVAFFEMVIHFTIWSNVFVACARMAGFLLLRGSYRALEAKTIAEFWNRFYFYFKELLVEFFFYPTFIRCFKQNLRLRVAFATFMAAGVGNILYHFMRDIIWVEKVGFINAVVGDETYVFYAMTLAFGIALSQLYSPQRKAPTTWIYQRLYPFLKITLFFSFLHIFDDEGRQHSLMDHFDFLFHLFGLK